MARSLKSYGEGIAEQRAAVRRRLKNGAGGIGTCAALDAQTIFDQQHRAALKKAQADKDAAFEAAESGSETQSKATMPDPVPGITPSQKANQVIQAMTTDSALVKKIQDYMKEEDPDG